MKRKDLGQHFLIDKKVIDDEITYASLNSSDIVLEIGPGKGALTIPLAQNAAQVIAIEKDEQLYDHLKEIVPENVCLIHADAVDYDFSLLPSFSKIVSNLPYRISSPITFKVLGFSFEKAVLMYQKEFAQRMVASPSTKEYSRLSVGVYYYAHCHLLKVVSRHAFSPKPLIDSCLVELIPRKHPPFPVHDETFFFNMVNRCFNQRRKKIKTIIRNTYSIDPSGLPYLENRIETLHPEQIGLLSEAVHQRLKK